MISYYDHHSQLKINVSKYHTGEKKNDKRGNQRCSFEKVEKPIFINPLTLVGNQHLISPYNITAESHIKVMRIKEMITN